VSFFNSEIVRAEMTEITILQEDIYKNIFKFPTMTLDEKKFHVGLLEKQIYTPDYLFLMTQKQLNLKKKFKGKQ
jgi:Zn-finger domain-containing protein